VKVVILAGGRGTRLSEETHAIPKPMVSIGGRPIIWHIMSHYAQYGFDDFVVACGYKGDVLKDYFATYRTRESDLHVDLSRGTVDSLTQPQENWRITLVDTGLDTSTGGRIKRLAHLLDERFLLTYGDGVSDVPIDALIALHEGQGALATLTAVNPIPRWGALSIHEHNVVGFEEKPEDPDTWINGGYFVIEPAVLDLITGDHDAFEAQPLRLLAQAGQLAAYRHRGFWRAMDTARDRDELNEILAADAAAPWLAHP
jgi:glucose-1-phosphate cytidylyltransferase